MKKTGAFLILLVFVLALSACTVHSDTSSASSESTQIPNPFTEYDSLQEAAKAVGFDLTAPESLDGYPDVYYRVDAEDKLLEVQYRNESNEICIRKAPGDSDISGDYNTYQNNAEKDIAGRSVTLRSADSVYYGAVWTKDGYSYSVYSDFGLSLDEITDIIIAVA